jgi:hypothetical protein
MGSSRSCVRFDFVMLFVCLFLHIAYGRYAAMAYVRFRHIFVLVLGVALSDQKPICGVRLCVAADSNKICHLSFGLLH